MFGILDYLKLGAGVAAGLMVYHLYAVAVGYPSATRAARSGYVLQVEKFAYEAKAREMERQRDAASQALDEHRKRLAAAEAAEQAAKDTLEHEIRSNELILSEKNRSCLIDDADRLFLQHH
jgi:hypothetical protein